MTEIEQLAIEYIQARRVKLDLKKRRSDLLAQCIRVEVCPCWKSGESPWEFCEFCEEGTGWTNDFQLASIKAAGLLRRLANAVKRREG